jgi:hypothetical protein
MRTMGAGVAEVYRERWPVVWGRWRSVVGAVVAVLRCCTAPTHLGSWPRFPQPTSRPQVLTLWIETDQFVTLGQLGSVLGDFFGLVIGHDPPSRCRPIPRRRHRLDRGPRYAVIDSWLPALSTCGRASAAAAPSGSKAGARAQPEPGSAPGGAERSRGLNQ